MPRQILTAAISDALLEHLICEYRDAAGRASRTVSPTPVASYEERAAKYSLTQNRMADIYQELLDRRRADPSRMGEVQHA
jgi:hypothetical protein